MPPIEVKVSSNTNAFIMALQADESELRDRAMVRALNKTAEQLRTQASRAVREAGYNLAAADIKKALRITYASAGNFRASVTASGRPIPLYKYGARQTSRGVSVNVKEGRKVIAHAFIATMPSGHKGVFVREATAIHRKVMRGNKAAWHALPIRELFGPGIPDGVANAAVQEQLQRFIAEKFPQILERESAWLRRAR